MDRRTFLAAGLTGVLARLYPFASVLSSRPQVDHSFKNFHDRAGALGDDAVIAIGDILGGDGELRMDVSEAQRQKPSILLEAAIHAYREALRQKPGDPEVTEELRLAVGALSWIRKHPLFSNRQPLLT